jgi:hypothetical protein
MNPMLFGHSFPAALFLSGFAIVALLALLAPRLSPRALWGAWVTCALLLTAALTLEAIREASSAGHAVSWRLVLLLACILWLANLIPSTVGVWALLRGHRAYPTASPLRRLIWAGGGVLLGALPLAVLMGFWILRPLPGHPI